MSSSPLPLSNLLLQPVQAQTTTQGVRTKAPVNGTLSCGGGANPIDAKLTFFAQGTSVDDEWWTIHKGTFQLTNSSDGQTLYNGTQPNQAGGYITVDNNGIWAIGASIGIDGSKFLCGDNAITIYVKTSCNDESETISIHPGAGGSSIGTFPNAVIECGVSGDGDTTAQPSSSSSSPPMTGTTTTQDGDRDGIPDSSDRCAHNSNTKCFKEA